MYNDKKVVKGNGVWLRELAANMVELLSKYRVSDKVINPSKPRIDQIKEEFDEFTSDGMNYKEFMDKVIEKYGLSTGIFDGIKCQV